MSNGGGPPLGHWPICDELIGFAEGVEADFREDFRAQGDLVWRLGDPSGGYWHLPQAHRQEVLSRVMALVPRVGTAREPLLVLERMFRLWQGPNPRESIARAVRVSDYQPRPLEIHENIYRVGGFSEEFLDWTSESNCPAAFLFAGSLIALASVCGFNFYIDRNVDTIRLGTHYTILTGKKGTHKSVGLDAAKDVLHRVNHLLHPWEPGTALPDFNRPNPLGVRMLPEDTNWRTIVGCLKAQPMMLQGFLPPEVLASRDIRSMIGTQGTFTGPDEGVILLDEAATIFGKQNFAVDRMVPGMTSVHGGRPYVYETQSGGRIELRRPALTFAGCCPPDIMTSALTPILFQGGLMDRMNVVHHEPLPGPGRFATPRPRDPVVAAHLAYRLAEIRKLALLPFEMCGNAAACAWFEEWYHALREPDDPRELSTARRANHLWRYAAYISLGNGRLPWITVQDFQAAELIQAYELASFRTLLAALESDPASDLMAYIEGVLYRHSAIEPDVMSRRDLFQVLRFKKGLAPPTVKAAPFLESLEAAGRIRHLVNGRSNGYCLTENAAADLAKGRSRDDAGSS